MRNSYIVFHSACTTNSAKGCKFFIFSVIFCFCYLLFSVFDRNHHNACEVVSHCTLGLHFPQHCWCWESILPLIGHLYIFFLQRVSIYLSPFLNLFKSLSFLILEIFVVVSFRVFCIFWILVPYQIYDLQVFSLILWVAFLLC